VDIAWNVLPEATRRSLQFVWVESGGPQVKKPTREGFGTRLLAFVLPGQIRAKTEIEYRPEGVRVHVSVPLPAEAAV
jgi:two-component sensor histidine kinase